MGLLEEGGRVVFGGIVGWMGESKRMRRVDEVDVVEEKLYRLF